MEVMINDEALDLIREFEGCKLTTYYDVAGVPTIGYGHTGPAVRNKRITQEEAEDLLAADVNRTASGVLRYTSVPLTMNQLGALTSWAYNVGLGAYRNSTLRKVLNKGRYDQVPTEMMRWTKARDPRTGVLVTINGLVRRRNAEAKLWSTPDGST